MAGGARRVRAGEEEDGLRAVARVDGLMGKCTLGVELGKLVAQRVVGEGFVAGQVVLLERGDDAVAGEHG